MGNEWLKKIVGSLFTKLLLIIIITGLCITLLVGVFFSHVFRSGAKSLFKQNIVQYIDYIIKDLGSPPNIERAKEIVKNSSMHIRYEGPGFSWTTSEKLPSLASRHFYFWYEQPGLKIGGYRGRHLIEVMRKEGTFTFELARDFNPHMEIKKLFVIFLLLLTAFLVGAYFLIRCLLRPIKWLTVGVDEVSKGNLGYAVPAKRSDELGQLARGFNTMTGQIRNMLHAKEELLYGVSHELRSPLTRMKVALEILPENDEKKSIKEDISEMEKMVSEILDNARLRSNHSRTKRERIIISDLIRDVVHPFEKELPGIKVEVPPQSLELYADREQVKKVLKNLLSNAIKYSDQTSEPVEIAVEKRKHYLVFQIKDHGIGIPQDELPNIFEPFYRIDKSRSKETGGYGLGLSLCKTIMEANKGRIEVESVPKEGTTVSLFFPELKG